MIKDSRIVTSHSRWQCFNNCKKKFYWRYIMNLEPLEKKESLMFGSLIHDCLEEWHKSGIQISVKAIINAAYPQHQYDYQQNAKWHLARAMMRAYYKLYAHEEYEFVALETPFCGEIKNPETGANSRTFTLGGFADAVIKHKGNGKYYLLETKTASAVDEAYISRLWTNVQPILYTPYIEEEMKIKISGTLYNILSKSGIKKKEGETEAEYVARKAIAIAKSKTGKSSAKRQIAETDEAFADRLDEWYANKEYSLHRHMVFFKKDQIKEAQTDTWENTQALLRFQRINVYPKNTSQCFMYRSECEYYRLCKQFTEDGQRVEIANHFKERTNNRKQAEGPLPF